MAQLTLTTPTTREDTVTVQDVNIVRIDELIQIDYLTQSITFRYVKGRISGSSFIREYTSDNVLIQGQNYNEVLATLVPDGAASIEANLHEVLLQYLIDQGIVGPGTIS